MMDDEHGQVSVELIVIIAAVVVLVLLLVNRLYDTGKNAADSFEDDSSDLLEKIEKGLD